MSVSLTVNGTAYTFPSYGDTGWGTNVTNWATQISNSTLQLDGGTFEITADVDFGTTYGVESQYYKSASANIATSGVLRLSKTDSVTFRNDANDGNLQLKPSTSNDSLITFAGIDLVNISSTQTLTNKTLASPILSGTPTIGGNTIWHAGNDGTGSTLDADTLDGSHASAFSLATHVHAINDASDITITSAAENEYLYYNGSAWVNGTPTIDLSSTSIESLSDVASMTPSTGDVFIWNGSTWTKTSSFYEREFHIQLEQINDQTAKYVKWRRAGTIHSAIADCESGTSELTFYLGTTEGGATAITGMSGQTLDSTERTYTASANNTFSNGDRLFIKFANSASPEDIQITVVYNYDI